MRDVLYLNVSSSMLTYNLKNYFKLNLRKLILILTILAVSALFVISLLISYSILKQELIENSLSINYEYASKIALNTDGQFQTALDELKYSAEVIGKSFNNETVRASEVDRLRRQSHHFNTVVICNSKGIIVEYTPDYLNLSKQQVQMSLGTQESLKNKQPYVSPPYYSVKNNLIVFISQPIFDHNHVYKGYVGAAIYLKEKNIINELLTIQYSYRNSYMYVLDQNNKIIFHPDMKRIGQTITGNTGLTYMNKKKNGKIQLVNSMGVKNLVGFAHIPTTNWIVVSQQPTDELLERAKSIISRVSGGIFLFYLLIFYLVWKASTFIASPLHDLAKIASSLNQPETEVKIKAIKPWYYEVQKFKFSLLSSVEKFSHKIDEMNFHINSDPLTGLFNRRGLEIFIEEMTRTQTHFAVLLIDIDYFKKINDSYGHAQGDRILKQVAQHILNNFRKNDLCCRYGGEEFVVLMPQSDIENAYKSAERLRKKMENTLTDGIGPITISIGIAFWPETSREVARVFELADAKLYQAKIAGRNQVHY